VQIRKKTIKSTLLPQAEANENTLNILATPDLRLRHMQPHHRTNHNDVFQLIILITITLESSNNTLPDDGD
jgi:hypothetical protein